jgi:hypothetical protein
VAESRRARTYAGAVELAAKADGSGRERVREKKERRKREEDMSLYLLRAGEGTSCPSADASRGVRARP